MKHDLKRVIMQAMENEKKNVEKVFDLVKKFFSDRAGDKDRHGIQDSDLLPIAYMGNVEHTIQGELFVFLYNNLREHKLLPVLEFAHGSSRKIDILVVTANHDPLVAIELKHHSSPKAQSLKPLLKGLDDDAKLDYPCSPSNKNQRISLIQVGLYTTIEKIYLNNEEFEGTLPAVFPKYKFIDSYAKCKRYDGKYQWEALKSNFGDWLKLQNNAFDSSSLGFTIGTSNKVIVRYADKHIYEVEGRVNYFVGLRKPVGAS